MTDDASARETAIRHVLREVHSDRREAEVQRSVATDEGTLFGVTAPPQGFLSQAKYAVVVVDGSGTVREATGCTRRELDERIEAARERA